MRLLKETPGFRFGGFFILFMLVLSGITIQASVPARTGWWKFDLAADLTRAESGYGVPLVLTGYQTAVNGPAAGNGAVSISRGSYFTLQHLISPNGGGARVNEYTLQYDFRIPESGIWHCFFQTGLNNDDDGDLFINPSGKIGVAAVGYSDNTLIAQEWYRLVVSVKNGNHFTYYLDGKLILSGTAQEVDGRFSLAGRLLIFADNNGEDGTISCSELSIWDEALTAEQAADLGGYKHAADHEPFMMTRVPYLQSPSATSITICWHDTARSGTRVEYGPDESLGQERTGTSELISLPYRWHTVKLSGLQSGTRYFYRVGSGNGQSERYSFRTMPDPAAGEKIRFLILSDTHCPDTSMADRVIRAAQLKITSLYGDDPGRITGILHSGDIVVSGNMPEQYTTQFFKPLSALSPSIPVMVTAGNHEAESSLFYGYLKMDELSAFPSNAELNEKIWQLRSGSSLFIGLNTNITGQYGATEAGWLDNRLKEAENDAGIDFVFLFLHHPPYSELWKDTNDSDAGTLYVNGVLLPILKKYTKVQQMHYGHTHGFERGTIQSDISGSDFRIICGGGGGGHLDPWAAGENQDFNNIHICFSHYFYQILEIDPAARSWQTTLYSLGSVAAPFNSVAMDEWYRKINQPGPDTPEVTGSINSGNYLQMNTSAFTGPDSLMSVQYQVFRNMQGSVIIKDSVIHWKNIFGIDANGEPVDLNRDINLTQIKIRSSLVSGTGPYYFRVRYRDHNLKLSGWSAAFLIKPSGSGAVKGENGTLLQQNHPNPFSGNTVFPYCLQKGGRVTFRIYDISGAEAGCIEKGPQAAGDHTLELNIGNMESGIYYVRMISGDGTFMRRMIVL